MKITEGKKKRKKNEIIYRSNLLYRCKDYNDFERVSFANITMNHETRLKMENFDE